MNRKQKKNFSRILITVFLSAVLFFVPFSSLIKGILSVITYLIIGYDVLRKAFRGILNKRLFDENFLMATATLGAIILAVYTKSGDYFEAIAVMLFYQIGEFFQSYAVGKSRKSITSLMDIRPDYANIEINGTLTSVDPNEVAVGDVIVIQSGERVAIDGIIIEGNSALNTSALTGESMPRDVGVGDEIHSGSINLTGVLKVRTTKEFEQSTASKILELVEESSSRKSVTESFISKFAKYYTPAVCYSALALAIIPPILELIISGNISFSTWIYRALTFLVISCPCALVISIPLTFFAGLGGASRKGILIKGSNFIEALSKASTVVFDKTGTLTRGVFEVKSINAVGIDDSLLLEYTAHAECSSSHPISKSIQTAYNKAVDRTRVQNIEEVIGHGVISEVDGKKVAVGNAKLMKKLRIDMDDIDSAHTGVHIAIDGKYSGYIVISDVEKPTSVSAIKKLRTNGVDKIIMLTGDSERIAKEVSLKLGIDSYYCELLPSDKVNEVEKLINDNKKNTTLAFVGDGINDAPVLARADIGIAMGAIGSDAAIEAADVVLMDDGPEKVSTAIKISRKCMGIVRQNIVFALGIKFACLLLGAFGIANMWFAVFADVGVMILAVINALRALKL